MWWILIVLGAFVRAAGAPFALSHALFPLLAGFLLAYITATNPALLESFAGRVPIPGVDREIVAEGGGDHDLTQAALVSALEARA